MLLGAGMAIIIGRRRRQPMPKRGSINAIQLIFEPIGAFGASAALKLLMWPNATILPINTIQRVKLTLEAEFRNGRWSIILDNKLAHEER
jgi:hypothetical protein